MKKQQALPITDNAVLRMIPRGEKNRITSAEIEAVTGLCGSEVRFIINSLRANFVPICSDRRGYFVAVLPEDIDHTIHSLNSRIHKMIVAREGLRKAQRLMMDGEVEDEQF